jgi:FG-GAP repeat
MRRIATVLLFSIVSSLWMGARASLDTASFGAPTSRGIGTEPASRLPVPNLGRQALSPALARAGTAHTTAAPSGSWLAAVERDLAAREYRASVNHRGLQAPNRAQNLRTYFEPGGIRVMDRTAPGEPELVSLRLAAIGREGALAVLGDARVSDEGARVELSRDGVTEWYENSPAGLEQGFTIEAAPLGNGPLLLELGVDDAQATLSGDEATLTSAHGRTLNYGQLAAKDANGTRLAARLETCDGGMRIVTDDRDAVYPVTIDPLLFSSFDAQLGAFQASGQFGQRVTSAGDVNGDGYGDIVVGTQFYDSGDTDEGAAFLYLGGPNGIANNASPNATFQSNTLQGFLGRGIASGDFNGDGYSDLCIGGYGYPNGGNTYGAAFVFLGGPSGMANGTPANAATTLHSTTNSTVFGIDVECAGDVNGDGYQDILIGDGDYVGFGGAFIFLGSATGVANATTATASTALLCNQASAEFGWDASGAGDVNGDGYDDIVIGAYKYSSGETREGVVFVWQGGPSGIASGDQSSANATLQQNVASMSFGSSVAGAGDVNGDGYDDLIVGAPNFANGQTGEGAVWLYLGQAGGIINNQSSANRAESNQASSGFGGSWTVAGAGDVNGDGYADIVVGAPLYDDPTTNEGAAFVFLGCSTGMLTTSPVDAFATLEVNQASAQFGVSVAGNVDINGDGYADILCGAQLWDGGTTNEGAAFIYLGGARGMSSGTTALARGMIESNQAGPSGTTRFSQSVASAGDVNGDGYGDLIVGAPNYDLGQSNEGAAFIFLGGSFVNGSPATANATLQSNQSTSGFAYAVASAGDVNGDGYADVIVGAPGIGKAFVFDGGPLGVPNGDPTTASGTLSTDQGADFMGTSVAGAGDVNGDGFADVIVGSDYYAEPGSGGGSGGAFIYQGGPNGIGDHDPTTAATRLVSSQIGANFGLSVAGAGDVNGDGYADVIVGAFLYSIGQTNEGAAFVYLGSATGVPDGTPATAATTLQSDEVGAQLGISVAGAGDVNGDGFSDVIVGADHFGANDEGRAWVWFGSVSGVPNGAPFNASMTFPSANPNGYQGTSVACAGDLNRDGLADMIVGAAGVGTFTGAVNVYMGVVASAPQTLPFATLSSLQVGGKFGQSVAGVGDLDGDGFADVIVGAPALDSGQTDEGAAFLFNGGGGLPARLNLVRQQSGIPAAALVQPWGMSLASDRFRVSAKAIDAGGRQRVKLEVEHCPFGVPFGSGTCVKTTSPIWTDAGANPNGVTLTNEVTSVPTGLRRWRARTLVAPFNVTQAGITAPPNPAHGPWRRFQSQLAEADLRVMSGLVGVEIRHDPTSFAIERLVNPTRGRIDFTVVLPGDAPAKAELFDVAGRRWLSHELPGRVARTEFRWDEGRILPSGTYLLRITQGRRAATAQVVIVH